MPFNIPSLTDILTNAGAAFFGGGFFSFLFIKLRRRKFRNEVSMQEYTNLDEALATFSTRMLSMSTHIEQISEKASNLETRLSGEKALATELSIEIKKAKAKLSKYEAFIDQIKDRCKCDEDFLSEMANL